MSFKICYNDRSKQKYQYLIREIIFQAYKTNFCYFFGNLFENSSYFIVISWNTFRHPNLSPTCINITQLCKMLIIPPRNRLRGVKCLWPVRESISQCVSQTCFLYAQLLCYTKFQEILGTLCVVMHITRKFWFLDFPWEFGSLNLEFSYCQRQSYRCAYLQEVLSTEEVLRTIIRGLIIRHWMGYSTTKHDLGMGLSLHLKKETTKNDDAFI